MISSKRASSSRRESPSSVPLIADVVAGVELGVEADAELDEGREQAVDADGAAVCAVDAGEDLQQRALAAAVRADDAEELALLDRERDVVERALRLVCRRGRNGCRKCSLNVVRCSCGSRNVLRDADDLERRSVHHTRSANQGSSRLKIQRPRPKMARAIPIGSRRPRRGVERLGRGDQIRAEVLVEDDRADVLQDLRERVQEGDRSEPTPAGSRPDR